MPNENINLVNRLNDFRSRIENFGEFRNVFIKLDKEDQERIINVFENTPGKTRIVNKLAKTIVELNKRKDLTKDQFKEILQFIDELPGNSQGKYIRILNDNVWHIDKGKIPIMTYELKCRAAVDRFEEHKDSIKNFEEFSDIFDIRGIETKCEKNPAHKKFINLETINKVNVIFDRVRTGSGKLFTNKIINLYNKGALEEIPKYIEIKSLSVQLGDKGVSNENISQFKNNAKGNDQYVNDVGEALKNNRSIQEINSIIAKGAPNIQYHHNHKPLKMIVDFNKNLNLHDQSKDTQALGTI